MHHKSRSAFLESNFFGSTRGWITVGRLPMIWSTRLAVSPKAQPCTFCQQIEAITRAAVRAEVIPVATAIVEGRTIATTASRTGLMLAVQNLSGCQVAEGFRASDRGRRRSSSCASPFVTTSPPGSGITLPLPLPSLPFPSGRECSTTPGGLTPFSIGAPVTSLNLSYAARRKSQAYPIFPSSSRPACWAG